MNEKRTEADQVVNDATQRASGAVGVFDQIVGGTVRAGPQAARNLIYIALFGVAFMYALFLFVNHQKAQEKADRQKQGETMESIAKTAEANNSFQLEQAKKLVALSGGIPATKSTKASRALPGLRGTWEGMQSCGFFGAMEETGIRLLLKANVAGHIDGVLIFYPLLDRSPDVPYGSYRVSGDMQGTEVNLHAGNWIVQPAGYKAPDMHFSLHSAPLSTMTGAISLKDYGHSLVAIAATVRGTLLREKLTDSCADVRLNDEVESIEF